MPLGDTAPFSVVREEGGERLRITSVERLGRQPQLLDHASSIAEAARTWSRDAADEQAVLTLDLTTCATGTMVAVSIAPIDYYDPRTGGHAGRKREVDQRELAALDVLRPMCARADGALLDIGCGDGLFLSRMDAELALTERGWKLHGIDYSEAQIAAAGSRPYRFAQCNVESGLPFVDESFDVVYCGELIEHLYDPDSFLAECHRVLRPGGEIAITTPNLHAWYNRVLFAAGVQPLFYETSTKTTEIGAGPLRRFKRGTVPVGHLRVFGLRALGDLLASQGFGVTVSRGSEFVLLPKQVRALDRLFNRAPSLASILVVAAERIELPDRRPHLRAVAPPVVEEPRADEEKDEHVEASPGSSSGQLAPNPRLRSPWVADVGLGLAGIAAFALAVVLVEAFTDRDWRLSGMEWPADFATAGLLVCLVPLVLFGLQLLLDVRDRHRRTRPAHVRASGRDP